MPDIDRTLRQAEDSLAATPPNVDEAIRFAGHVSNEITGGGFYRPGEESRFRDILRSIRAARNQGVTPEPSSDGVNDRTLET